jgi:hypothetical protein
MRDDGFALFLLFAGLGLGLVGGCTMGRNDLYRRTFMSKELCYEAEDNGPKWKTCYALVKKSEAAPDQQKSR